MASVTSMDEKVSDLVGAQVIKLMKILNLIIIFPLTKTIII